MTFPSYTHFHDDGFAVCMQETTIMKISRRIKHFKSKFILFPYNAYNRIYLGIHTVMVICVSPY